MNDTNLKADLFGDSYRLAAGNDKFWRKVIAGEWEAYTFAALEKILHADSVYLDIGAWIGPTVLFAARRCKTVYCVEPDAVAYERLLANLRMNEVNNVRSFHGALDCANGFVNIANAEDFGNSETRVTDDAAGGVQVLALDIFSLVKFWSIQKIDLLKMDVEGAEFELIPSLIEFLPQIKPTIHLSLHAPFFPSETRAEKLTVAAELAAHYNFIYDKHLNPITADDIFGKTFTEKFSVLVLSGAPLH